MFRRNCRFLENIYFLNKFADYYNININRSWFLRKFRSVCVLKTTINMKHFVENSVKESLNGCEYF